MSIDKLVGPTIRTNPSHIYKLKEYLSTENNHKKSQQYISISIYI